ncbi:Panacea domain-containing protein [Candidatus Phytoplasma pyri]|uniref:Panacea domain-containing protein n=1 Tax=Candidatus Phytoplasma pyri TaxID=47566 RepID=UPI003983B970
MEKKIKKISKQLNKLNKSFALFKKTYYNSNIKNNYKKEQIMENNENEINIFDIAEYIIKRKQVKASNLKLNKLIYYCYAKYLVQTQGKKLISNPVQAWMYGPVFPDLYHALKKNKNNLITEIPNTSNIILNFQQMKIINYVICKYGDYDPFVLMDKTHNEDPWYDTFPAHKLYSRRCISDEKILKYYSKNPV